MPVAETFAFADEEGRSLSDVARLDTLVTVVDALNFLREYAAADYLPRPGLAIGAEDDRTIVDLLVDQVEFANVIVVNKADLVSPGDLARLEQILRRLNPEAALLPARFGDVPLACVLNTGLFDFEKAARRRRAKEPRATRPESEEYGVGSFVYRARVPFHPQRFWKALRRDWKGLLRSKGFFWLASRMDVAGLWSQAGGAARIEAAGRWMAGVPRDDWPDDQEAQDEIRQLFEEPYRRPSAGTGLHRDQAGRRQDRPSARRLPVDGRGAFARGSGLGGICPTPSGNGKSTTLASSGLAASLPRPETARRMNNDGKQRGRRRNPSQEWDVVIVGAGPAGIGVAYAFTHFGVRRIVVLERREVAASFARWPAEMRLHHAVVQQQPVRLARPELVRPARLGGPQHRQGTPQRAGVRPVPPGRSPATSNSPVQTGVDVRSVRRAGDGFVLHTSQGEIRSRFVVWAAGEFQYPKTNGFPGAELCQHNSRVRSWRELGGDNFVVIGGYESGVDAAIHLAVNRKKVVVLDARGRWRSDEEDPSVSLSPFTRERLEAALARGKVELVGQVRVTQVEKQDDGFCVHTNCRSDAAHPAGAHPGDGVRI